MQELEQTWARIAAVWRLIMWRGTVFGGLTGFVLGLIIGILGQVAGLQPQTVNIIANFVIGFAIGAVWMLVIVRMAVKKNYRGFRVVFVPPISGSAS
jgi:uncharacterized membrane protein YjjP (DUF1212 family)